MKRITIKDLAEHAAVSRGTVDRVIHNRGHVAPEVKKKIQQAIDELGYTPNILARTLAQNHQYRIAALIPNPQRDEFWSNPNQGIGDAIRDYEAFGVVVDYYHFDNNDVSSFNVAGKRMIKSRPDAILMACEFYHESLQILDEIQIYGIPVVLFMTQIDHQLGKNYIGQDSFQSGMMVGRLFDTHIRQEKKHILAVSLGASEGNTLQIMNKLKGVKKYFDSFDQFDLTRVEVINFQDESLLKEKIEGIMERNPTINGVFVTNSRARYVAEMIKEYQSQRELCFIGFDLLSENVAYLKDGVITFLINQNPYEQVALGIKRLVDQLVFKRTVNDSCYVSLDIVIKENVDFYIN